MKAGVWLVAAVGLWWLVSASECGAMACLPAVIVIYSSFWLPIVAYIAVAEAVCETLVVRSPPLVNFVILMLVGMGALLFVLKSRNPLLFVDAERSMTSIHMIIIPTCAVIALYLLKLIVGRLRSAAPP